MARRKEPKIPDSILDQLLGGADPKTAFDPNGLLDDLKKALAERALNAEIDHHLANGEAGNSRNGYGKKTVVTDTARIELDVPRDRQSSFDPHLIAKYQRRFPGFDEKIISMYDRRKSGPCRHVNPSNRSTRWSFSTLCASKSGTKGWCAIRPCMSH
jgi:putative transposase